MHDNSNDLHRLLTILLLAASLIGSAVVLAKSKAAEKHPPQHWSATWATASKVPVAGFDPAPPVINNVTLRQVVRISEGGETIRVRLTNELGHTPLNIGEAHVAIREAGSAIDAASNQALTFGGQSEIAIAAGARVVSDPVWMAIPDLTDLSISIYLPDDVSGSGSPLTQHVRALQSNYIALGNQSGAEDFGVSDTTTAWHFLSAVDVANRRPIPVIAVLGDSITDGDQLAAPNEPVDLNERYSNFLSQAIISEQRAAGVINLGISGNQVTNTFLGEKPGARFSRDVLAQTGVTHVIFIAGINDIGLPVLLSAMGIPTPEVSAAQIIAGHQHVVARVKAAGLVAVGGTLSPAGSSSSPGYSGGIAEGKRQAVNEWIRSSGAYDIVVDFDEALRDPVDPTIMRAGLTADGLHPNAKGYRIMADVTLEAMRQELFEKKPRVN